jgi:hypothetical protein
MSTRTKFFSGFGKLGNWRAKTALECFKFSLYLTVPLGASLVYNDPKVIKFLIESTQFVVYPERDGGVSLTNKEVKAKK